MCLWDPANGQPTATLDIGRARDLVEIVFSPDSTRLATTRIGDDGRVCLWDPANGQRTATLDTSHTHVSEIAFSPDSTRLATAGGTIGTAGNRKVQLWDPATGQPTATLETTHDVSRIVFSPDGTGMAIIGMIIIGGSVGPACGGRVRLWDPATGQRTATLDTAHTHGVGQILFSPDGTRLATAGDTSDPGNGQVQLWDPATGQSIISFRTAHNPGVGQIVFSPDGTQLAVANDNGEINVHDCIGMASPIRLKLNSISHLYWIGDRLAALSGGTIAMLAVVPDRHQTVTELPFLLAEGQLAHNVRDRSTKTRLLRGCQLPGP